MEDKEMSMEEGAELNKQKHLSNLKREVESALKQKAEIELRKGMLEKERDLSKKNHVIIMSKFKLLKVTWLFEEDEDYINNTKEINQLTFDKKLLDYQSQLDRMDSLLKAVDGQVETLQSEIVRIEGGKDE